MMWFDIQVLDLDRAVNFYTSMLNLICEKVPNTLDPAVSEMHILKDKDSGQMLGCLTKTTDNKPSHHGTVIYIPVKNIKKIEENLKTQKGRVTAPLFGNQEIGYHLRFIDSEGNIMGLSGR